MKAVLISIQPKWCELISSGKKTVEVRKTKPKLETPFKVYIYCTYGEGLIEYSDECIPNMLIGKKVTKDRIWSNCCNGKVIGEFVCDKIEDFYCASIPYRKKNNLGYGHFIDNGVYKVYGWHEGVVFERSGPRIDTMLKNTDLENMCLSAQEVFDYIGIGKHLYGWHISDLVIYDEPKELREFRRYPRTEHCGFGECELCQHGDYDQLDDEWFCRNYIARAPQSWCYVED